MLRISLIFMSMFVATVGLAAEWTVDRLRGEALYQVGGSWLDLSRGQEIGNGVLIRTGANGRVDLVRGAEAVSLGASTQIQIRDAGSAMMTSIIQDSGTVTAEVERRNVQHFSVQTPFLAAVVKGTKFVVTVDGHGAQVDVERGVVQVQDSQHGLVADIRPGQEATVTRQAPLDVVGGSPVQIFTFGGLPVEASANEPASNDEAADQGQNNDRNHRGNHNENGTGTGNGNGNGNGSGNSSGSGNGNGNGNGSGSDDSHGDGKGRGHNKDD